MASFTDLVAQQILLRREEFLAGLSDTPENKVESVLAVGIQAHWHPFEPENTLSRQPATPLVAAVDGSRAIRALNIGADWIIAQALLIGPHGLRSSAADTLLLRGEIERPAINRYASLLMRSLELDRALEFVHSGSGNILLLDGSLYADLPYLLYTLEIGGYEDFPLRVLEKYLTLFDLCQKQEILLLGISKSARSTVLGRALLEERYDTTQPHARQLLDASISMEEDTFFRETDEEDQQKQNTITGMSGLPTDGEILSRWTVEAGLTDPILLGSASFHHTSAQIVANVAFQTQQSQRGQRSPVQNKLSERLSPLQEKLLLAPAIGTFYVRLAPGEDILRVDALASSFGSNDLHLLAFARKSVPYTTALPIVQLLRSHYGGPSVYNAALYVVDKEVRLHAETVDHVYLPILRRQLGYPVQYDRSTRRFIR
jgi:prepilin-type processing-associated H-X9-DG protein